MDNFSLSTPVAMLVFNRPELTARVFAAIRAARPQQLLIVADGPRNGHPEDVQRCAEIRRIVEQVDWPCRVFRNFSETNLGCKLRVSSGLDWVFSQVEEAIILEDDCLPDYSFFRFCQEMLENTEMILELHRLEETIFNLVLTITLTAITFHSTTIFGDGPLGKELG